MNFKKDELDDYWIRKGYHPILISGCKKDIPSFIRLLYEDPSSVLQIDPFFESTLLHIACEEQSVQLLDLILEHPQVQSIINKIINKVDHNGDTALHVACGSFENRKILKAIKMLIDTGIDFDIKNKDGLTALEEAQSNDSLEGDIVEEIKNLLNHHC